MISPFDTVQHGIGRSQQMPQVPWLGNAGRGAGAAVRLEFQAITIPHGRPLPTHSSDGSEQITLREEAQVVFERETAQMQEHIAAEVEAAFLRGSKQGLENAAESLGEQVTLLRMQVLEACTKFQKERDNYFSSVEAEIVGLALAIAGRVLHREVGLDPMLLRGVVRVALGKIADESGTILRVPEADVNAWRGLTGSEELGMVEVSGDARMSAGECVLETKVGRVELGITAQLEEIEKGFFDLLQRRPA